MVFDPALLDRLQAIDPSPFEGIAFRHMFGDYPPDRENTRGARWNPTDVSAIYLSIERETAIAEGDHMIAVQPLRPRIRRTVYTVRLTLGSVLDLRGPGQLEALGVGPQELAGDDHSACRQVGGGVAWLGHDGLLVPSARSSGSNLVIYPDQRNPAAEFEQVAAEEIAASGPELEPEP